MPSPSPHRWLVLSGVWLIYCTFGLVAMGLAPIIGTVERDLGMSHTAMGGVLGAWQLVYIGAALPCGVLLDRLGSRHALLLGALCIAASSWGRGSAQSFGELLAAVMLFGLGGPIVSAGAPKVITAWFHGAERGLAMGIYVTGPSVGAIVSLTATHPWLLPACGGNWRRLLAAHAVAALLAGFAWWGIASLSAIRPLADARSGHDHVPHRARVFELLEDPVIRLILAMAVGVFLIGHAMSNWLPELLMRHGLPPAAAGYWAALPIAVGIAGSLTIPRFAIPARRFRILVLLCGALLGASLLIQFDAPSLLFPGLVLQGIARATLTTVLVLTLVELPQVGTRHAGLATGLFFGAGEIGGMAGPWLLGALYDLTGGFTVGLACFSGLSLALIAGARRLRRALAAVA
ncbi:MAG: CynX/NimT family MFS transporter [Gammaproteobacteria bacterium]